MDGVVVARTDHRYGLAVDHGGEQGRRSAEVAVSDNLGLGYLERGKELERGAQLEDRDGVVKLRGVVCTVAGRRVDIAGAIDRHAPPDRTSHVTPGHRLERIQLVSRRLAEFCDGA